MDSTLWGIPYSEWRFINTFAPWLAAAGTLSAVGISLFLIWREKLVRLNILITKSLTLNLDKDYVGSRKKEFINIKMINGVAPVFLSSIKIKYAKKYLFDLKNLMISEYKTNFPFALSGNEMKEILVPLESLLAFQKTSEFKNFIFIVETSEGKKFKKKIDQKLLSEIRIESIPE